MRLRIKNSIGTLPENDVLLPTINRRRSRSHRRAVSFRPQAVRYRTSAVIDVPRRFIDIGNT